jgi:hypothetical protein
MNAPGPRELEAIRNTLQELCEHHIGSGVAKNFHDQELLKCTAIIEQIFRTFEVIQGPCPIIIFF